MNKLLLVALGAIGLLAATSKKASADPYFPPGPPPPEPDAPPPEPVPGSATPADVSVTVPAGYRRLAQNEVTSSLTDTALSILKLNDKPGTKYPFEYDGSSYYAGVEMSGGRRNISLFVRA
jgi:hypothetical protein